jgi:hypothetical protein
MELARLMLRPEAFCQLIVIVSFAKALPAVIHASAATEREAVKPAKF